MADSLLDLESEYEQNDNNEISTEVEIKSTTGIFSGRNCGHFTWNIDFDDTDLMDRIITASPGDRIICNTFTACRIPWLLELYPNIKDKESWRNVKIYLRPELFGSALESIVASVNMTCNQTLAGSTQIKTFTKDVHGTCNAFSWPNKTVLFREWKQSYLSNNHSSFSVDISIKILQVTPKLGSIYQSFRRKSILPNDIDSDIDINHMDDQIDKEMQYSWTINEDILSEMKHWPYGKSMVSEVFDIWQLVFFPKGKSRKYHDEGFVSIFVKLCVLPSFVKSITAEFNITSDQPGHTEAFGKTREFSISDQNVGNKELFMEYEDLRDFDDITFILDIKITEIKYVAEDHDELLKLDTICGDKQIAKALPKLIAQKNMKEKQYKAVIDEEMKKNERLRKELEAKQQKIDELESKLSSTKPNKVKKRRQSVFMVDKLKKCSIDTTPLERSHKKTKKTKKRKRSNINKNSNDQQLSPASDEENIEPPRSKKRRR